MTNLPWNQQNPDICDKLVFAHPLTPNACFPSSIRPDSYQKVIKKEPGKKHETKTPVLLQSTRKAIKMVPEIHIKSMRIRLWIPGCPFCCSYGLPGLPQGAKVVPQGAKMEPPSLPTDSFGHQKWPHPLRKSQLFEKMTWKLTSRIQRSSTQFTR